MTPKLREGRVLGVPNLKDGCGLMTTLRAQSRAMTLSETLIVAAGLGLVLLVVALGMATVRNDLKTGQVWELLATLDQALSAYHQATGQWPAAEEEGERGTGGERETRRGGSSFSRDPQGSAAERQRDGETQGRADRGTERRREEERGRGAEGVESSGGDRSAERVIAALRTEPASRELLDAIPKLLWAVAPNDGLGMNDRALPALQDAWGQRLRCLTSASRSAVDRQAVAGNAGRPVFISAGIDGEFGSEADMAAADDNLRSDELPR